MKPFPHVAIAAALMIVVHASHGAEESAPVPIAGLEATLAKYVEASKLFYNGQPDAVKALWSHADDVTLSGAAGGKTAKGWNNVSARLEWASSQFSKGSKDVEIVQRTVSGDFAYIVQYEYILFYPPGKSTQSKRDYRVTTIFRREPEGWRVVHRHADTLMERQAVQ